MAVTRLLIDKLGPKPHLACFAVLLWCAGCGAEAEEADETPDALVLLAYGRVEAPNFAVKLSHDKPDGGQAPLTVSFHVDVVEVDPHDFIISWDFKDGLVLQLGIQPDGDPELFLNAEHTYLNPGTYCVRVMASWRYSSLVHKEDTACVMVAPAD